MRDINRIPNIIKEIEDVWKANPDFRLGQLMCVFTRPKEPNHEMFNIEDDELMKGLNAFKNNEGRKIENLRIPYWERYPNISKIDPSQITIELIESYIEILKNEQNKIIITPRNLMKLNGAPIDESSWINKQEDRIERIKKILKEIERKNKIKEIEIGYKIS